MKEQDTQEQKNLTPAEIYRKAAEIYESLPKGQELDVIEALCNMMGRTAVNKFWLKVRVLGVEKECANHCLIEP